MKQAIAPQTDEQRKAFRDSWEDKNLTMKIDCPEHPKGKHQATLFQEGHRYAGIWECPVTGTSDSHEHEDTEVETVEVDTMRNGEHDTYESQIYVCVDCRVQVDGDPAEDAHDAMVDAQIDEARGK